MRVRSRVIPINKIAAEFGGGGHDNASGIKVSSREEVKKVLMRLDAYLEDYKRSHGNLN